MNKISSIREEYTLSQLNKNDLNNNPFQQFELWLNNSYKSGVKEPNAMSIATVNSYGQPSIRMVLLRSFNEKGFVFYTNYLSNKGKALSNNNKAALLFFWDALQQQIRIEGDCEKISPQQSDEYFNSRPFKSRVASSISPQSSVIESRSFLEDEFNAALEIAALKKQVKRPEHWGGYIVKPNLFEFWQGRKSRMHDRFRYTKATKQNNWLIERLAP